MVNLLPYAACLVIKNYYYTIILITFIRPPQPVEEWETPINGTQEDFRLCYQVNIQLWAASEFGRTKRTRLVVDGTYTKLSKTMQFKGP